MNTSMKTSGFCMQRFFYGDYDIVCMSGEVLK